MLESVLESAHELWERMGTPMSGFPGYSTMKSSPVVESSPAGVVTYLKKMDLMNKVNVCTVARSAVACVSVACIIAGVGLLARTVARSYGIRDLKRVVQPESLIPLSQGEKEPVSNSAGLIQRVKSVFANKVIPGCVGVASIVGGVFMLAHTDYFAKALRRS